MFTGNIARDRDVRFDQRGENELKMMIDNYDQKMLTYIGKLYEIVNGERIDLENLSNITEAIQKYNEKAKGSYLDDLLHPEKRKGCKIPSAIPVPSAAFQLHNSFNLKTNQYGNLCFFFNPFFLYDKDKVDSSVFEWATEDYEHKAVLEWLSSANFCNYPNMDGSTPVDTTQVFNPINMGQGIPGVYNSYRLVSASVVVKYIGRFDIASGVIGGAIINDTFNSVGAWEQTYYKNETHTSWTDSAGYALGNGNNLLKYTNFDLAMDSFYHQENMLVEGLRMIYFPLDNSYEEYVPTNIINGLNFTYDTVTEGTGNKMDISLKDKDALRDGFNFFFYTLGGPTNTSCIKVDIYCNFECLPNAEFLNYLPLYTNPETISTQEKKEFIKYVQENPIMKAGEMQDKIVKSESGFSKIMGKLGKFIPGINELMRMGVIALLPRFKNFVAGNNYMETEK